MAALCLHIHRCHHVVLLHAIKDLWTDIGLTAYPLARRTFDAIINPGLTAKTSSTLTGTVCDAALCVQFIDEADRSLHDAIMIVRRALKHAEVVPGGGAIEMEVRAPLGVRICLCAYASPSCFCVQVHLHSVFVFGCISVLFLCLGASLFACMCISVLFCVWVHVHEQWGRFVFMPVHVFAILCIAHADARANPL